MKKRILSAAVLAACMSSAVAQEAAAASPHTFTGNLTVASDYRFRGLSQTQKEPTIQGGFDYAHSSGFYVGNWNSNVSSDVFPDASIEMDVYAGYTWAVTPDLAANVGVLQYIYPGATGGDWDTTELYFGATYKGFSAKYSHTVSDFFGVEDSKGSGYLDLGYKLEVADKTTLALHVGHQKVRHSSDSDYTDYSIGIARDFGFATIGLTYVGTDTDLELDGEETAHDTLVLALSKSF